MGQPGFLSSCFTDSCVVQLVISVWNQCLNKQKLNIRQITIKNLNVRHWHYTLPPGGFSTPWRCLALVDGMWANVILNELCSFSHFCVPKITVRRACPHYLLILQLGSQNEANGTGMNLTWGHPRWTSAQSHFSQSSGLGSRKVNAVWEATDIGGAYYIALVDNWQQYLMSYCTT